MFNGILKNFLRFCSKQNHRCCIRWCIMHKCDICCVHCGVLMNWVWPITVLFQKHAYFIIKYWYIKKKTEWKVLLFLDIRKITIILYAGQQSAHISYFINNVLLHYWLLILLDNRELKASNIFKPQTETGSGHFAETNTRTLVSCRFLN